MDWLTLAALFGGGLATASGWIVNWWSGRADRKRIDALVEHNAAISAACVAAQTKRDEYAHQLAQLSKDYARERKSCEGRIGAIRAEVEDLRARADQCAEHMPTRDLADALARVLARTEARDPGRDAGGTGALHRPTEPGTGDDPADPA